MTRARGRIAAAALVVALALSATAATGCGSSSSSTSGTTIHFAKTKFLLHAGLAFGAFHHFIYKPYKAGGFSPPSRHKAAIVKAGLAAAFAYHETKLALEDARASRALSVVLAPVLALQNRLRSLSASMHGGNLDASGLQSTNAAVDSLQAKSTGAGAPITEHTPASVG